MILYDYWRSSAAYRVRIALALKGVAYERRPVSLLDAEQRAPEHLARNPQGLVPALEVDGRILTQSLAIIDWLDARHPEPRLIPADADARADALAQALVIGMDIHPLNNLRVLHRLKAMEIDQQGRDDWTRHWIAEGFAALEAMVRKQSRASSPFLGGDAPGVADIFLVPQMFNARRFDLALDPYPTLVAADAAARALPAFAAAHPDAVKA
jgi:maleylacetoacetate isomerase